jgi:competence protein ComEC
MVAALVAPLAFTRWRVTVGVLLLLAPVAAFAGAGKWEQPFVRPACAGWAHVIATPNSYGLLVIELGHQRLETTARGSTGSRLSSAEVGEWVWVDGVCSGVHDRRHLAHHVVGRMHLTAVGAVVAGSPWERSLGWVHRTLRAAAQRTMPPPLAALFTGLVLGDASQEPVWLSDSFRRSGLAHLQAVSGENLAFVLAAALPLLRVFPPIPRLMVSLVLVLWFVALTGASASVLRAAVMATVALVAWTAGYKVHPLRSLCWSVVLLELVDPLLVWSVGFWLSVSATGALVTLARPLADRLPGPRRLASAIAVAVAAQTGAALPSLLVFHTLAPLSVPANLAAIPAAGVVMLVGIPSGLIVGAVAAPLAVQKLLMIPSTLGCRWVLDVARLSASWSPTGTWAFVAWIAQALVVSGLMLVRRNMLRRAILNG